MLGLFVILLMDFVSDLDQLIEMLNLNYAASLLMEYAAFFQLRIKRPELERPYRIPFGTVGCLVFFAPSLLGIVIVMLIAGMASYIMFFSIMTLGILLIFLSEERGINNYGYCSNLPVSDPDTDVLNDSATDGNAFD